MDINNITSYSTISVLIAALGKIITKYPMIADFLGYSAASYIHAKESVKKSMAENEKSQ